MTQTLPRTHEPSVGKPVDRVDGTAKTTGAARFAAEYPYPGLAHAALVHATVSRGRITAIDTTEAAAIPGVITVLTHHNAPALKPPRRFNPLDLSTMASGTSVSYLNTDEVHWDGQPVAVVVAETLTAAREAAALVEVSYTTFASTVDFKAEEPNAEPQKGNLLMSGSAKKGDAEAALAKAPVRIEARFTTPPHHHNAIEPHATTAMWDGDRLTVHDGTQSIDWLRSHLALRFDVPVEGVRVLAPFVGGGFGGKANIWPGTILTVMAARATGRPVRLLLTREDVYRTVGGRTPSTQRVALGARTDGTLTALVHTSVTRTGRVGGNPEQVTSQSKHLYDAENILVRQNVVELDLISNTAMRAPGDSIGTASIDELAYELGMDPIELRMRNEPERNPIDGRRFANRKLREAYRLGAERFGWADRTPEPGSMRDGRWLVGMGVATAFHPAWQFLANVTVRLSVDGSVLVRCGFQEMGMGGATAQAQIAADALGVPVESVRVEYGDSSLPLSPAAGGSMQTASVASSVLTACEKLRRKLARLGRPGDDPAAALARAGVPSLEVSVGSDTRIGRLTGQVRFLSKLIRDQRRWMKAASGAQFCEVRVDPDTGETRVSRWTAAFDVGRVINAKTAVSQLRGGIVMGIGMALSEETLVDPRTGRIMNPGLGEYHVPVHADVPPIDVAYLDEPDPTMPLGLIGVGEVGITGAAAAIANAIHHATGRRIRELPITLDKLL
ncbi:xanthine dehydrogenase family protein molybdopterin-binding subunit [Prauserella endophytica]|uniref:Xanthine dehydrogenase family protein molybdopterin-binding subunit n=1 Tax=Prauserella endophytica TaxID=1592324 RepID=A0ABY2RVF7_9PSEU|nr:xanthine dehydrogenase family protein molybdopterin-binding subunit [Prauserella endophytica]TKG62038.1 xanthine dehydrogenase family protein molybdopterin-binding subunit [Prauserella endophytica]